MSNITELARGQLTAADVLVIELADVSETPPAVLLRWPPQPSVVDPIRFPAVANAVMAVLAAAVARLSAIRSEQT
jgi:hypothetical protein